MTDTRLTDPSTLERFTPAMRQFLEVKLQYPETLVLFRMGDFYETFFEDAVKAHRLIGLTLTKRGKTPDGEPIAMAGIPMVSLDGYIARLVAMGESVVIVEQLGQPGKGMMERKISRIVTPGTLTDSALLSDKADNVLLALTPPAKKSATWGLAWLTLSNGDFEGAKVEESALESALARIAPTEILVPDSRKAEFRERFAGRGVTVTPCPDWHFDAERGEAELKKRFGLEHLDAWGVAGEVEVLAGVNALLDYTTRTQVDLLPFILPLKLVATSDFIVIDPASRRHLELTESMSPEGDGPTLFSTLDGCKTGMGSRTLRKWLHEPPAATATAQARQNAVAALAAEPALLENLTELLAKTPDLERIVTRTAMGNVRPKELAALRDALPLLADAHALLAHHPVFAERASALKFESPLYETLCAALLDEPATLLRDGDVMRSEYNEELATLRNLRDNTSAFLVALEERERSATGIATLRVEYNRVAGFFIEVSKAQAANVPAHYTRRQTLKNTERFITPELKSYEEKTLSAKERAAALDKALYDALVAYCAKSADELMRAARTLAEVDVFRALAAHAVKRNWCAPTLTDRPGIVIHAGRHPVVECAVDPYVPSDCALADGRRCLVITGPNMGGKSTFMRSVALIVLLARLGSFVPAASAEIGPVDRIHTRIGASDDLARGRSTFMVEMTEAAAILHQATDRSLVLMDEIGRGTSTFDGLSLASAIAEELVTRTRAFTLFATHYFELTHLAYSLSEAANVHVSAVQEKDGITFLHEVKDGPANRSYGIAVAQLAGIPARVVRKAKATLLTLEARDAGEDSLPGLFESSLDDAAHEPVPEVDPAAEAAKALALEIASIAVDDLTPRQALDEVARLQAKAAALLGE